MGQQPNSAFVMYVTDRYVCKSYVQLMISSFRTFQVLWKIVEDACRCMQMLRSFNWSREKPAALDRASALSRLSRLSRDDMAWWFLFYFALSVPFCAFAADAAPETANAAAVGGATAASVAIAAGVEIMRRYLCKSELRESNYACSHLFMFCWLCLFSPPSRQVQVLHRDY